MNNVFSAIARIIEKYPKRVWFITILTFVLLLTGALNIKMATGNETLVDGDKEVFISNEEMETTFGGESIIVMFEGEDNIFTLENVEKFYNIENNIIDNEHIFSIISPSTIISQMMKAGSNNQISFPTNEVQLNQILFDVNNEYKSIFSDLIIDSHHGLMIIKLVGNLDDDYKEEVIDKIKKVIEEENFNIDYTVTGKPVLDSAIRKEMKMNMMIMVILAVIIMFIVLSIIFKVHWRFLSLGIILTSVIGTLGLMGLISVPITMVSMAVFPILIGLGIDYSIQFHNRFEEEKSVEVTINQIAKAVLIAVVATVLGFVSLYASSVPMIRDFGIMLTIGVIISFIGSVFLLMPILKLKKKPKLKVNRKEIKESRLEKVLEFTTKKVIKHSIIILIITLLLSISGIILDSKVGVETDIETFMPQDMEALSDIHKVRDKIGSTDQIIIYLKDDKILTEENINWIKDTTTLIRENDRDIVVNIKSIDTLVQNVNPNNNLNFQQYQGIINNIPDFQKKMFINIDKEETIIVLSIEHLSIDELEDYVYKLNGYIKDSPLDVQITGKSVLDVEMVQGLTQGRILMTVIGLILVFSALLIIYRNFFKALLPIIPVVLIIGMSSGIMYVTNIKFTPITSTLGALILGMGTEMTVMLSERYIEERMRGREEIESITLAVKKIGKAIIASGLTTVGGFSVLLASKFVILKDFGTMTVINIALALFSTFIVLPPIIIFFDKFIIKKKKLSLDEK